MGTGSLAPGVRAGGGNTGWLWMSSCNLGLPVLSISFLIWLLLAAPGAQAAGYKVSWGQWAEISLGRVELEVWVTLIRRRLLLI